MNNAVRRDEACVGSVLSSSILFVVSLGAILFVLVGAFHGNIWFDESYSIALASHSLPELIAIGATDVHPVLYYVMLRVLYVMFGPSILAMRLFSVCGTVSCVILGWTVVRKDHGNLAAVLFIALVVISPWAATEAVDIRMYSWAAFFTGLSYLFCMRIVQAVSDCGDAAAAGEICVPSSWWTIAFAAALAAAYTHYFAAITSFMAMVLVLVSIWRYSRRNPDSAVACALFRRFRCGVGWCVLGYLPWVFVLVGQAAVVSGGFWIKVELPMTLLELIGFPISSEVAVSLMKDAPLSGLALLCWLGAVLMAISLAWSAVRPRRGSEITLLVSNAAQGRLSLALGDPVLQGFFVFFGTAFLALGLGVVLGQAIFMTRYMVCALIPIAVSLAVMLVRARGAWASVVFALGLTIISVATQVQSCSIAYDSNNADPVAYYEHITSDGRGGRLPVVSGLDLFGDIQAAGPLSVQDPSAKIEYLDFWPAYNAFSPTVTFFERGTTALDGYRGRFVYLAGRKSKMDIRYLADDMGAHVVEFRVFTRPYHDSCWTIALMERQ